MLNTEIMSTKPRSDAVLLNLSDDHGSHLINSRRWRDQRFGPASRREEGLPAEASAKEGACPNGPVTDEQRSGRPKDRSLPDSFFSFDIFPAFLVPGPCFNAAASIYEMASNLNRNLNLFGRPYFRTLPAYFRDVPAGIRTVPVEFRAIPECSGLVRPDPAYKYRGGRHASIGQVSALRGGIAAQ